VSRRPPQVRVHHMKVFVEHLTRLPAEDRRSIRNRVPESTWHLVEAAGALGWLPMDVNLACTRAVAMHLGPERSHEFFRSLLLGSMEGSLLRGLVNGVLRVAVPDPGLYLPWVTKGFELLFRNVAVMRVVDRSPGSALTEMRELPRECTSDDVWLTSAASSFSALLELVNLEGSVVLEDMDANAGVARLRSRWNIGRPHPR